jgi:beta subunit of N-acylethanolamine-hydrolyzing acid amidase
MLRVLLVAAAVLASAAALASAEKTLPVKTITVDLNTPPAQRWDVALKEFGGPVAGKAISSYFTSLTKFVPHVVLDLIEMVAKDLDNYGKNIPKDLRDEMRALATGLDLDLGMVVALNYRTFLSFSPHSTRPPQSRVSILFSYIKRHPDSYHPTSVCASLSGRPGQHYWSASPARVCSRALNVHLYRCLGHGRF